MTQIRQNSAFFIKAPRRPSAPIVFDSPHSGFVFPPDFRPVATREQIQTTWDAYVDELCGNVGDAGATLIAARFPRAYIDANRAANDIDPEILDTPWPQPTSLSPYTVRGMGLIRRYALPAVPMYNRRLTVAEVTRRIDDFYVPYRNALRDVIDSMWQRHGAVWHFNCHSMKSGNKAADRYSGISRPDFVIGDRDGTSAPPALTRWVAEFFSQRGYGVKINEPYRGFDIVRTHGDPARRRYSVQIEINRALYMDERTCERSAGFPQVKDELTDFSQAVAELARNELAGGGVFATALE